MSISEKSIFSALRTVNDPEVHRDLISIGAIKKCVIEGDRITLGVASPGVAIPASRQTVAQAISAALNALADGSDQAPIDVRIEFLSGAGDVIEIVHTLDPRASSSHADTPQAHASGIPGVDHIIAVGAGKGGVGKSTIAVNLAVGMARNGLAVGLMDGDIYGPSLPTMMGLDDLETNVLGDRIQPFFVHNVKCSTVGKLVERDKPLIWRGPMAHGAFKQLAEQTEWGELDFLIIDLPPGTGDVPLTMAQLLSLDGAVIVCTPQKVAQDDAVRAANMFKQLGVDVLGVVENMSYFVGDDGKEYDLFGRGGAERMAQRLGLPYLGGVPINTRLRENSDTGDPTANFEPADQLSNDLQKIIDQLQSQVQLAALRRDAQTPILTVH